MDEFIAGRAPDNPQGRRGGYAEWIALGAVVAGSVGAIMGAARSGQSAMRRHAADDHDRPDGTRITAPHGDKLMRG